MMIEMGVTKNQWRWVVLVAVTMGTALNDGILNNTGVFLVPWMSYFNWSMAQTSAVISANQISFYTGAYFAHHFGRYGYRPVVVVGGALNALGIFLAAFSPTLVLMCLTLGVISGFFGGITVTPFSVALATYMDKNFSTFRGISCAGIGASLIIFPPMLQYLTDLYTWQGCLLIFSGLVWNVVAFGLLLRPESAWRSNGTRGGGVGVSSRGGGRKVSRLPDDDDTEVVESVQSIFPLGSKGYQLVTDQDGNSETLNENCAMSPTRRNCSELDSDLEENDVGIEMGSCQILSSRNTFQSTTTTRAPDRTRPSIMKESNTQRALSALDKENEVTQTVHEGSCKDPIAKETAKENNATLQQHNDSNDDIADVIEAHNDSNDDIADVIEVISARLECSSGSFCQRVGRFVGLPVFQHSYRTSVLIITRFTIGVCYSVATNHLLTSAIFRGVSTQRAAFLMSFLGIGSVVGRLCNGMLIDIGLVSGTNLFMISMIMCGVGVVVWRVVGVYWLYAAVCLDIGAFSGALFSLEQVLVRHYVGKEHMSMVLGMVLLSGGVGSLIGPVLGGWLYDVTDSYDYSFYLPGGLLIATALLFTLEQRLKRCEMTNARCFLDELKRRDDSPPTKV